MSKTIGNVINPKEIVEKHGKDPFRYYLLGAISSYQDGDFSEDRFRELYTSDLANGIGNLTSRILSMIVQFHKGVISPMSGNAFDIDGFWRTYREQMREFEFHDVIHNIQTLVSACDTTISEQKPWEMLEKKQDISHILYQVAEGLRHIAIALLPIMPESAEKILTSLGVDPLTLETLDMESQWGRLKEGTPVTKGEPLFPR